MKTKQKKFSKFTRMSILALAIVVSVGLTAGGFAKAESLRNTILDRVADKIAEKLLGSFVDEQPEQPMLDENTPLGFSSKDEFWVNNDSGVIYLGKDKDVGIRRSSGVLQGLQSGTWSALSGITPGDEGWVANGINNSLYPSTNAGGTYYPVAIGVDATSSPATVDTELFVGGGGGLVITGVFNAGGAVWASSTLQATGAAVLYNDLTVYNGGGARIGTGSSGGHITALASDSLLVEGESEFDGITWFDESLRASSTLMVTGATTLVSTLGVTGATTLSSTLAVTGAVTLSSTLELGGTASTTGSAVLKTATINSDTGAISFGNENLTTTGNFSGANGTFTGSLTIDTNTLYVNNSSDRVGIGSTTPSATLSIDTNAGDDSFVIGSSTATILTVESDYDLNYKAGAFFLDYSSGYVGLGSTTPFAALGITNTGTQLDLAYDTANYTTITTGSGGDLTIVPSGGDLTITGTLAVATTTVSQGLIVDTNTLVVNKDTNRVGIGTSTPNAMLSVGAIPSASSATSTIDFAKPCFKMATETGTSLYMYLKLNANAYSNWATSTTSCF